MLVGIVVTAIALLAFSNGANDNFKGVATIYGSGTASYRAALAWATATTLAGSACALALASGLVRTFSARGLVPDAIATSPAFIAAAALGAAVTVLLATRLGFPVSTTHALTGSLVGAGLLAAGRAVDFSALGRAFVVPLLASPLLAVAIASALYPLGKGPRRWLGMTPEVFVRRGTAWVAQPTVPHDETSDGLPRVERYRDETEGLPARRSLDAMHFASAGAVCFARALNDTPKIVALLIAARTLGPRASLVVVGLTVAVGGALGARRVAETVACKITPLTPGQGLAANLTTATLVLAASRFGLPVSTTHVSTGAIFGIGLVRGTAQWSTVAAIVLAWVTTLPVAAAAGAVCFAVLRALT